MLEPAIPADGAQRLDHLCRLHGRGGFGDGGGAGLLAGGAPAMEPP
jgi:hypothetical protein